MNQAGPIDGVRRSWVSLNLGPSGGVLAYSMCRIVARIPQAKGYNDMSDHGPVIRWIPISAFMEDPVVEPAMRWIPVSAFLADDGISPRNVGVVNAFNVAEVITGCDSQTGREFILFGLSHLKRVPPSGIAMVGLGILVDESSDELRQAIDLIRRMKGHDEYTGGGELAEIESWTN